MSINSIYICDRFNSTRYDRPPVYKCKGFFKEANSKKTPILINGGDVDISGCEYVAFPKNHKFGNEDIYLTLNNLMSRIDITYTISYRCVGIEVRSLLRFCWVPIEEDFFEKLIENLEFSEHKQYIIFKDVNKDMVIKGNFKIEDGFLRLDAE